MNRLPSRFPQLQIDSQPGERLNPSPAKRRWPILAAINAAALLIPLLCFLHYSRRDDYVYDFAYALVGKWAFIAALIASGMVWMVALAMRRWKSVGGDSRGYRVASGAITGMAIAGVTTIITLAFAEILSPLYLPAFNELSGLHQVEDDPDLLFTLKPNGYRSYVALGTDERVEYRINSQGFRGGEFPAVKEEGVIRILAIGDSMTFGLDANIEDSFAAQLEEKLGAHSRTGKFEVINGGVSGYNTWNEVNFLEKRGLNLEPNIVVFQFCFNDAGDPISLISAISYFHFKELPDGMFPSPAMLDRHEETILTVNKKNMSLKTALLFTFRKNSRLFGYFNRAWAGWKSQQSALGNAVASNGREDDEPITSPLSYFHEAIAPLADTSSVEFAWLRDNFERLKKISESRELPVIVLIPPINLQIAGSNETYNRAYDNMVALAQELGLGVCAPLESMREQSAGNPATLFIGSDEVHYNRLGNRIVAEELKKEIDKLLDKN